MRIVIDTNILISGIFFQGKERNVLELWFNGKFDVICTEEIFEEYSEVIMRFTKKSSGNKHDESIGIIAKNCIFIKNVYNKKYSRDPDDDKFINCAMSGEAPYIVSGDKDLLVLKKIGDLEIITASNFLKSF
ncbi:MAG: putative toxin-antitoxin system toxin component, PIN family [bacterium]